MATTPDLSKATDFVWRTARLLDRHRFAFLFLDGGRQAVLEALRPYHNADGGIGNGLEPDVRAPVSQPVPTWTALCLLDEAQAFADPMVTRACEYAQPITTAEGGVPFVLPSVRAYPHAPWWAATDQPSASLNPTAAIAALLHKYGVEHPWLTAATEYCCGNSMLWSRPLPTRCAPSCRSSTGFLIESEQSRSLLALGRKSWNRSWSRSILPWKRKRTAPRAGCTGAGGNP